MFPKHHNVQGYHNVQSVARDPSIVGKRYARVWFRTVIFFVPMALVGVADLLAGVPSGGYYAIAAFTLIPMWAAQVM